jgi:ABC-type multidrug transport system fused ATPase/permease subunit
MQLRSDMFEALLRREIAYFDKEENAVGDITNRLSEDSRVMNKAAGESKEGIIILALSI